MSATAMGRGPIAYFLQSSGSQWIVLGLFGASVFGGSERAREAIQDSVTKAIVDAKESGSWNAAALSTFRTLSGAGRNGVDVNASASKSSSQNQAPIVIHTHTTSGRKGTYTALVVQFTLGAASCWAVYAVLSNTSFLPDAVKEIMPVNRKLFDKAVKSLGEGIIHVRDSLSEQLEQLLSTQKDLQDTQDRTLEDVQKVKDDMTLARDEIGWANDSLRRCENSLESSRDVQDYTGRGVRLLVRCVATLLPSHDRALPDLIEYLRDQERLGVVMEEEAAEEARKVKQYRASLPNVTPQGPEDDHPGHYQGSPSHRSPAHDTPQRSRSISSVNAKGLQDVESLLLGIGGSKSHPATISRHNSTGGHSFSTPVKA